jgi:DNA-binding FadR family transcriptional regulator
MLLFSPLGSTDVARAVVGRLRAAIGMGLLPDGERLPKESELAEQLGVTSFALREALSNLRDEGLIVTRAGKNGGSFVTYPAESEQLEHDRLVELSAAELRDIGDWRQMLAAHAAALAGLRASDSNVRMLQDLAAGVGQAQSSLDARRMHGRFLLELASAGQSPRMTRAEFAVHEQIDWLFGLALHQPEERSAAAERLAEIAAAVRARNPKKARLGAERHVAAMVARLAQLRLAEIAARKQDSPAASQSMADAVREMVDGLIEQLRGFAHDVGPVLATAETHVSVRSRVTLAAVGRFDQMPDFVQGMGVLAEVGVVPDRPYWIEWWQRTEAGPVEDNHHVLDPEREDFYDYSSREYMERPRASGEPWAQGPYVDSGGVDDFVLTVAVPITVDRRFLGVSCADVLVADVESRLSPWLAGDDEAFLVNDEGRVIVSNSMTAGVGDLLAPQPSASITEFPAVAWRLVTQSRTADSTP